MHGGRGVRAVCGGRGTAGPRQRGECRAQPLPRPVRAGSGGARDQVGRSGAYGGVGAVDRAGGRCRCERARLGAGGTAGRGGRTAGRTGRPGAAEPCRCRGPVVPRRLSRPRRLHRPAPGLRARPRRSHPRGHRLRPGRAWRCRLPHRPQMAGHGVPARPAPLPGVQRRRVRAGHLQGPRDPGGRPVRAGGGDDDRRVRDRRPPRPRVSARRVSAGPAPPGARDHAGTRAWLPRRRRPRPGLRLRHRDPARCGRLHLWRGDGPVQLHRGLSG